MKLYLIWMGNHVLLIVQQMDIVHVELSVFLYLLTTCFPVNICDIKMAVEVRFLIWSDTPFLARTRLFFAKESFLNLQNFHNMLS